jgi:hypothetical protein
MTPDSAPVVHGDERTPPTRYAGIAETAQGNSAPIRRGTARRLGLNRPQPKEPFSWELFAVSMAWIEANMATALRAFSWQDPVRGSVSGGGNG